MYKKKATRTAERKLQDWANWLEKIISLLGYSSENHIVAIGLPHNPINRQMGDLSDLPMMLAKPEMAKIDYGIRNMPTLWQTMIGIRYLGKLPPEEKHRQKIGISRYKYWDNWTQIYQKINTL